MRLRLCLVTVDERQSPVCGARVSCKDGSAAVKQGAFFEEKPEGRSRNDKGRRIMGTRLDDNAEVVRACFKS